MRRIASALIALSLSLVLASSAAGAATVTWRYTLDPSLLARGTDANGFGTLRIDGYPSLEYLGFPSLPYRVVGLLIPQGETVTSCRFETIEEIDLAPAAKLAAYRGSARDDGMTTGIAIAREDAASPDGSFPRWRARHLGSSRYRGYEIASIAVYPVRCDLATGAMRLVTAGRLVVETAPAATASPADRMRRVEGFRESARAEAERLVVNPEATASYSFAETTVDPGARAFAPAYEPSMEGSEVAYLIITNDAMASAFQKLADWKTKQGVPAVVRTVEWIGSHARSGADLAESVRNYIRDAYEQWGVEWVLLGGDSDIIPARMGYVTFYTGELIPTDMYYACLDGTWNADGDSLWGEAYSSASDPGDECDLYAEVYLGRMPASTAAEASILVAKAMNYATPKDIGSKRKFLMLGEVVFPSDYHVGDDIILDGAEIAQSVYAAHLSGDPDVTVARLFENYPAYAGSLQLTRARTIDSLNAGTNQVLHIGHGYKYNMSVGDGSILNYDANGLTNGNKLFSMYLMNCTNVAFDTDCLAEYFLLNANGGAFAVTGSSRSAFPSASRPYLDTYYELLFDHDVVHLGKLYTLSREPYTPSASGETADRWTHFIYNYLGDPEIAIFQGAAKSFAVTKPSSAAFGPNDITISVTSGGLPFDSALVCLYKKGDDYVYAATGPSGQAVFNDVLVKSAGTLYVTVTGINHAIYADSIVVAAQTPAYLRMSRAIVNDDVSGNNDHVLDAGETADLRVELQNTGLTEGRKLYAKLRTSTPGVAVSDSVAVYPNIQPYLKSFGLDNFRITVLSTLADGATAEFALEVRDSTGGFWSERFALDVHAPRLELYVMKAADILPYGNGDGVIEEGESFFLQIGVKNFGSGTAYGLSGTVVSLDGDITVIDGYASYNPIALLDVKYGDGFVLQERSTTMNNYFQFTLTDARGRQFVKTLELRKPGPPATVVLNSTYGPHEIHVTWHPPDTVEAYRYLAYVSTTAGGPYVAATPDKVLHTLFRDTGLEPSTRYYYIVTTIDSCGNESVPSAEKTATTSPPQLTGWPNHVGKETASSVKIGDVDGDRHPDVVVGSDYVYAWRSDGVEVRDGDGQPLTWGIFSTLGSNYTATVALADLDGQIGLEIVGASWNTKQIYVFNKNGVALSGWPKTTTYLCWASPVVGDIDGDGDLEIIAYDVSGIVYAWHINGTEVRDGDANPATNGPFFVTKNPSSWHMSTPAIADMDNDGVGELVVCSPSDSIYCLNGNGSRVPGWPVKVADAGANITASAAIGDIDADGRPELVVGSSSGRVYGLNHDGTSMSGWPKWIYLNTGTIAPSPALADLDGDGKLEVVVASLDRKCYIYRANGTDYPGWPQYYASTGTSESSPMIVDVDGDGSLDIVLGCEEGLLNAWKQSGESIAGFPIQLGSFIRGTPMAQDLDLDGDLELAASCWDQNVYVWQIAGDWRRGCIEWNGFHGNVYNSGWKNLVPATAAGQIECLYRLGEDVVELEWSVPLDISVWNLYRAGSDDAFELIGGGLFAEGGRLRFEDRTAEEGVAYRYRLEADGRDDLSMTSEEIMLPVGRVRLYQNHPNPFNPSTTIPFTIPGGLSSRHTVHLAVYDVSGALVRTLASGAFAGGRHEARWDGRNERGEQVASGIYFARLAAGGTNATRKLILLR